MSGFTTTLNETELDALITGDLKERVVKLLKGRHQCKAINLVKKEKGVSIVDAISTVNKIFAAVDPIFGKHHGRR